MGQTVAQTTLATLGGIGGLALIAWPLAIWWEVRKCEKPRFTLLRTLGQRKTWWGATVPLAEVRLYAPYLCAEVTMRGGEMDMRKALGGGFRQIAGFIFGKNIAPDAAGSSAPSSSKVAMTSPVTLEMRQGGSDSQKIAMTSPVTAEMGQGEYRVSFIMPSQYTKDNLPKPVDPSVEIKEMPARAMVALTWHGKSPREAEVEAKSAELRALMAAGGLTPKGAVHCWQYDPPFQWRWFRTNEVLFEVEGEAAAADSAATS